MSQPIWVCFTIWVFRKCSNVIMLKLSFEGIPCFQAAPNHLTKMVFYPMIYPHEIPFKPDIWLVLCSPTSHINCYEFLPRYRTISLFDGWDFQSNHPRCHEAEISWVGTAGPRDKDSRGGKTGGRCSRTWSGPMKKSQGWQNHGNPIDISQIYRW